MINKKKVLGLLVSAFVLSSCIDNINNTTDMSSLLSFAGIAGGDDLLLDSASITGFVLTGNDSPTPIQITVSGSAVDNQSCKATLFKILEDGSPTVINSSSFTTYGLIFGGISSDKPVIFGTLNPAPCIGLTVNVNVNFNIGAKKYTGSASYTYPTP